MSRDNPSLLVVTGRVPGQLKNLENIFKSGEMYFIISMASEDNVLFKIKIGKQLHFFKIHSLNLCLSEYLIAVET